MTARLNPFAISSNVMKPLLDFAAAVEASGLEPSLMELIKIRSSQINGCVICLDMHTRDARKRGETETRIYLLDAWHESALFTPREKAALGWTDALTRLSETRAPDDVYQALAAQFTPQEQVNLTMMINVINSFNRIGVGFRLDPMPAQREAA